MSDLDKLMKKLKKEEPKPVETPTPQEEKPKPEIEDEDEDEEVETPTPQEDKAEPIPANVDEASPIEHEVALLQNDGVFRRELLMVGKEKNDVLKIIAQTLLDIKKKLTE
ncbi:MAG: hypothetical protein DRN27_06505 [Thermoplasmata archaeon]|nr:MAG: hypothetical protein DRN27_06505 [Thermoplasmata archaeon]